MKRLKLMICGSIVLVALSCKKDKDNEPKIKEFGPEYVSQLVDNSGWSTYAYDDQIFAGEPFRSFYYEHEYAMGNAYNNAPVFLTYSHFLNTSGYRFKTMSWSSIKDGKVVKDETKAIGPLYQSLTYLNAAGLPENVKEYGRTGYSHGPFYRHFFYKGEHYAQLNYYSKAINTWRPINIKGIFQNAQTYGWIEDLPKVLLKEKMRDDFNNNGLGNNTDLGNFDLAEINGEKTIVHFATFEAFDSNLIRSNHGCLAAKKWNNKDSIDFISQPFYISDYRTPSKQHLISIGNKFAVLLEMAGTGEIYWGDFKNGLSSIYNLPSNFTFEKIIKIKEFAFIIYSIDSKFYALRISSSGNVTDFGALPDEQILDYAIFKGNLILGFSTDNKTIKIRQLTSSGAQTMGPNILTKDLTGKRYNGVSLCFASDNNNLYAAIKNNLSPKFKGATEQWTGWEIIKYNP